MSNPDTKALIGELLKQEAHIDDWLKAALNEIAADDALHVFPEAEDANNTDYVYPH